MPGTFGEPASYAPGSSRGCSGSSLRDPVPPSRSETSSTPGRTHRKPVPSGPPGPLWPGTAIASATSATSSSRRYPALCAASTTRRAADFAARSARPTSATGCSAPVTFDTCASATSLVRGVTSASTSTARTTPSRSAGATFTVTRARCSSPRSGRTTELCSICVVTTSSPGSTNPLRARFNASVAFSVKAIRSGVATESRSAARRRASSTIRRAARPRGELPRSGATPGSTRARATASRTRASFGHDVAAWSR